VPVIDVAGFLTGSEVSGKGGVPFFGVGVGELRWFQRHQCMCMDSGFDWQLILQLVCEQQAAVCCVRWDGIRVSSCTTHPMSLL
jgi:hypothetical protein